MNCARVAPPALATLKGMIVMRMLLRYGGWRLAVSAVAGILAGTTLAAMLRLVHQALTQPVGDMPAAGWRFGGLIVIYFLGMVVSEHALTDASERLQLELRQNLLHQFLSSPLRRLETLGVPRLFGLLVTDVETIARLVCRLPGTFVNLAIAIGCFGYMAWLSLAVFLFNLVFIAVAAGCYLAPERVAQRYGREAAKTWEDHAKEIHFAIHASKQLLLSSARRADFFHRHFSASGRAVRVANGRSQLVHLLAERFAEALMLGNVACLLFVLPRFTQLTPATAAGLLLAVIFARQPLKDLLGNLTDLRHARLALTRMQEAGFETNGSWSDSKAPVASPLPFRELVFEGVTFRYENDHDQAGFASGPFTLRLQAGETVFLVGGNGAGKTTLAKLLCGLYPPDSGRVSLDGVEITDAAGREQLRDRFSAVFLEDPIFPHVLGLAPAEAETRGRPWLEQLKLGHKVRLAGTEFSTVDLSQGQRRRMVLLAALVEERPVLLLDEWASDQDPAFRVFFYDELLPVLKAQGRTVVLITHDDRYFDRADRLIKMESGRIAVPAQSSMSVVA